MVLTIWAVYSVPGVWSQWLPNICFLSRCLCSQSRMMLPRYLVLDEGYLNSTSFNLPLTGFTLSGTGYNDHHYQYHSIGPLICYQCKSILVFFLIVNCQLSDCSHNFQRFFFENFEFTILAYRETKSSFIWTSDRRAQRGEIWTLGYW